jgi:hypothetical protein
MINSKDLIGRGCSIYVEDSAFFWSIQHEKVDEDRRTVGSERKTFLPEYESRILIDKRTN